MRRQLRRAAQEKPGLVGKARIEEEVAQLAGAKAGVMRKLGRVAKDAAKVTATEFVEEGVSQAAASAMKLSGDWWSVDGERMFTTRGELESFIEAMEQTAKYGFWQILPGFAANRALRGGGGAPAALRAEGISQARDGTARLRMRGVTLHDATAAEIDTEVMRMLKEAYGEAKRLLAENRDAMDQIAEFLIQFGEKTRGRLLPSSILSLSPELLKAFVSGYRRAEWPSADDGKDELFRIVSVNSSLILMLLHIIEKAYGTVPLVHTTRNNAPRRFGDRVVEMSDYHNLDAHTAPGGSRSFIMDDTAWYPVRNAVKTDDTRLIEFILSEDSGLTVSHAAIR